MRFVHDLLRRGALDAGELRVQCHCQPVTALSSSIRLTSARTVEFLTGVPSFLAALSNAPW